MTSGSWQIDWSAFRLRWYGFGLGNCRKQALLTAFESVLPQLRAALESGERIVEIR